MNSGFPLRSRHGQHFIKMYFKMSSTQSKSKSFSRYVQCKAKKKGRHQCKTKFTSQSPTSACIDSYSHTLTYIWPFLLLSNWYFQRNATGAAQLCILTDLSQRAAPGSTTVTTKLLVVYAVCTVHTLLSLSETPVPALHLQVGQCN